MSKAGELRREELIKKFNGNDKKPDIRKAGYITVIANEPTVFRHFKGNYYIAGGVAHDCEDASRVLVVYQACADDKIWAREVNNFFSYVDFDKYPLADSLFRQTTIRELFESGWTYGQVVDDIISKKYSVNTEEALLSNIKEEYDKWRKN